MNLDEDDELFEEWIDFIRYVILNSTENKGERFLVCRLVPIRRISGNLSPRLEIQ